MDISRDNWNAGDRPSLRVTASGISLLAYLDYVNIRTFISPDLLSADTRVPTTPPEQYDVDRPQPLEAENPEDGEITGYEGGGTWHDEWYDDGEDLFGDDYDDDDDYWYGDDSFDDNPDDAPIENESDDK